jgi:hypothetical protein
VVEWVALQDLCEVSQGAPLSRLRNDQGKEFDVIQVADLDLLAYGAALSTERLSPDQTPTVQPDNVLLSLRGSPIRAAVVPEKMAGSVASPNIAVLNLKPPKKGEYDREGIDPHFLAGLLSSEYMRNHFKAYSDGGAVTSLSVRKLREVEIPIPSVYLRDTFAAAFRSRGQISASARKLMALQSERLEAELDFHLGVKDA